ncbi:limonene-1,2-epoxide hydrolase family protein [Streptomyces nigra]|uniref:limonene-1,2-epoxide hydrolase family protein n=1 Tax=Streptomyces nigra TaxID=1827580 RepID=UPI0036A06064
MSSSLGNPTRPTSHHQPAQAKEEFVSHASSLEAVQDFCASFGPTYDDVVVMFKRLIPPNVSWQSVTTIDHPVESLDAMLVNLQRARKTIGAERFRVDVHRIQDDGDVVLVHRTDTVMDKDGNLLHELDMMSMFRVEHRKIRWSREYFFDSRHFAVDWDK